ncbi:hypothetical protein AWZ03_013938 [Drosophila navojoa]|uniref:Uncharacterized protein n=1 Tax=Drosophila navojoa TaxID=7232 RepID=A0A484AVK9_DRONA|nr:hypothetical protein AWZ03_013938 [Drosophila navojoa]
MMPKKLKKDKKGKDRDSRDKPSLFNLKGETSQQSRNSKKSNLHRSLKESKTPKVYSADPEILSLSNSSMSSILSGDAVSGNFQTRPHPSAADLTFAGRFKSAGRLETFSNINSLQANGQKSTASAIDTSSEVPTRPICEENNDSNTSCSRLSPYDELEPKFDQIRLKSCEERSKQSCEERIPKKRGRKKGSKGVDSLIAKESSLSQQIFFGSGVKKTGVILFRNINPLSACFRTILIKCFSSRNRKTFKYTGSDTNSMKYSIKWVIISQTLEIQIVIRLHQSIHETANLEI